MLTPSSGVLTPAISRATRSIVPSPPNTMSKSTERASATGSTHVLPLILASCAVTGSVKSLRPVALMSLAARSTERPQVALSGFPMSPTRWIVSAVFFNQYKKFFVACRSEQR